jgi:hypothetical protein
MVEYKCALRDIAAASLNYIIPTNFEFCNNYREAVNLGRRLYHAFRMKEMKRAASTFHFLEVGTPHTVLKAVCNPTLCCCLLA